METLKSMQQTKFPVPDYETWKQEVEKSLKGKPFEDLYTSTYENIELKPLYTKEDIKEIDTTDDLPGFSSYVRGTNPLGFRDQSWKIAEQLDFIEPLKVNKTLKSDLKRGLSMIHIMVNDNTTYGIENMCGKKGVLLYTIDDFQTIFDSINLESIPVLIDADFCSLPIFAQFIASMKKTTNLKMLSGTIGMDPLGALLKTGTVPVPFEKLYDIMAAIVTWAKENTPSLKTILIRSDLYEKGGANAVQQVSFALSTGVEYINECLSRGLTIDEIMSHMTFSFSMGSNMFMEIAKLRAVKMLWAKIIKEYGGSLESQKIHIHANTSTFTKTAYDPYVNILRSTTEAFSAIIGGVDSLSVSPFDETSSSSTDFSRRIARNIQIILKEEANLDKVLDPAGGSWYVESLTNDIAEKAWGLFQQIETIGGMSNALQAGFIQKDIEKVIEKRIENINIRKDKIVGVNYYANIKERPLQREAYKADHLRYFDDYKEYQNFKEALKNKQNIVEHAIVSALSGASISELMRYIIEPQPIWIKGINPKRVSEHFEELRITSEKYKEKNSHLPKVGLINLGETSNYKSRADFITSFFEAGGFVVVKSNGASTVQDAVRNGLKQNVSLFIICGTDEQYLEMVPEIVSQLKKIKLFIAKKQPKKIKTSFGIETKPNKLKIFVAGKQSKEIEKQLILADVKGFIHQQTNCYEFLEKLLQELGGKDLVSKARFFKNRLEDSE